MLDALSHVIDSASVPASIGLLCPGRRVPPTVLCHRDIQQIPTGEIYCKEQ